ncbi:MAG: class I SAM-dependent methyltransferase, partial [Sphingomonas sp.]
MTESAYDDPSEIDRRVLAGRHRAIIGGAWEEIGRLQLEFLIARGLKPHHVLLDIGCGPLRAGVRIIPYLDPGKYWGVDNNETLLRIGYDLELRRCGLQHRQPRDHLLCLSDFEFDRIDARFDVAIAHSLFTHLSLNRIRRCLTRLASSMKTDARLYATIFEVEREIGKAQQLVTRLAILQSAAAQFQVVADPQQRFVVVDAPIVAGIEIGDDPDAGTQR